MEKLFDFDFSKPKIRIGGGARSRHVPKPKPVETRQNYLDEDEEFNQRFIERKCEELSAELAIQQELPYNASVLTSYDHIDAGGLDAKQSLEKHGHYLAEPKSDTELAIFEYKQDILRSIRANQVTIINGGTGCGKTTQVPQYVLDNCYEMQEDCNIIVTQPRRIAASSIANRVCEERNWPSGTICGYQIGQNQVISADTRLLYCTTGILLQRLIYRRTISDYTHIFLDEVHERSQDMDFLLLLIRLLLKDSKTKIILMSATMDNKMFMTYFKHMNKGISLIEIQAPCRFPISVYYLDNLGKGHLSMGVFEIDSSPDVFPISKSACLDILKETKISKRSHVLIFLPGLMEIRDLHQELLKLPESKDWKIFVLHSSVPSDEQALVMRRYEAKYRKIILATNIAESSITLPDVEIVIDFCLSKSQRYDRATESVSLQLHWISQHEGMQRRGRVGRVLPGRVYRLVPSEFYSGFNDRNEPEMLYAPIETTVLRAKVLRISDPISVLSQAIEPPSMRDIRHAIKLLKETGALTYKMNGVYSDCDGELTFLGNIISKLPLGYQEAKLVALGHACGVLEDAVIIASYLTLHRLFMFPLNYEMDAYRSLRTWADNSQSDAIAALTAFKDYQAKHTAGDLTRGDGASDAHWARQCYLQLRTLKEMDVLVNDIHRRLKDITADLPNIVLLPSENDLRSMVLKFVIAGAFYGNYFCAKSDDTEQDVLRELNGLNPLQTVSLKGFPIGQVGEVYGKQIQDYFKDCGAQVKPYISFYCERIFVEFPAAEKREQKNFGVRYEPIRSEMYLAVYKKLLKKNLTLRLLNSEDNELVAQACGFNVKKLLNDRSDPVSGDHRREVTNLPAIDTHRIYLRIVWPSNPGHFMACYDDPDIDAMYQRLERHLARFIPEQRVGFPGLGCVYLAKRQGVYVRVRAEEVYEMTEEVQVLYIDIGKRIRLPISELFIPDVETAEIVYGTPAYVFECRLAKIEPAVNNDCLRKWSTQSFIVFQDAIDGALLNATVYSVVDGVVRLTLNAIKDQEETCINTLLIEKKVAVMAQESYLSELNQTARQDKCNAEAKLYYSQTQRMNLRLPQPDYPDLKDFTSLKKLTLSGPASPLRCKVTPIGTIKDCAKASVSSNSVNAVIFNTWPEDSRGTLLIGHGRSFRNKNSGLSINGCTLMPDIRGLDCLIPVLFAPRVQLRADPLQCRYASALCGMGIREDGSAIYPENDFNVVFDTEFTNVDLKKVNQMREAISMLLYTSNDLQMYNNYSRADYVEKVQKIQRSFSGLLVDRKKREKIYPDDGTEMNWDDTLTVDDNRILYPVHRALNLRSANDLLKQLEITYKMSRKEIPFTPLECPLCNDFLSNVDDLYGHTITQKHRNQENILIK